MRDRDLRRQEVAKAFQICSVNEQKLNLQVSSNSKYCVGIEEAWEERGYLFICSELCERGNLNDYILTQMGGQNKKRQRKEVDKNPEPTSLQDVTFCTEESGEES